MYKPPKLKVLDRTLEENKALGKKPSATTAEDGGTLSSHMTFLIRLHFIVTFGGYVLGYVHCVHVLSKLNLSKEVSGFTQSLDGTKEPQIQAFQILYHSFAGGHWGLCLHWLPMGSLLLLL